MQCNNFHHHSGTMVQRKCGRSMFFLESTCQGSTHCQCAPLANKKPPATGTVQNSDPCPVTVRAKGTARVCIYRFTTGSVAFHRDRGRMRSIFASLSLRNSCCPPSKRPNKARCTGTTCPKDESDKLRLAFSKALPTTHREPQLRANLEPLPEQAKHCHCLQHVLIVPVVHHYFWLSWMHKQKPLKRQLGYRVFASYVNVKRSALIQNSCSSQFIAVSRVNKWWTGTVEFVMMHV